MYTATLRERCDIIGGFLGGVGYAIYMLAERRRTEVVIEMDKPDIVWIEIEEVGR